MSEISEEQMATYNTLAKEAEEAFHKQYRGARVTYYLHYKFYHFDELQKECLKDKKTLAYYQQQGWEQMNNADRNYIKRHTSNGAQTGRKSHIVNGAQSGQKRKAEEMEEQVNELEEFKKILVQRDYEPKYEELQKMNKNELKKMLNKRGLSTTGKKDKLITDYLHHLQKEEYLEWEKQQRKDDPIEMNNWLRASLIVALFKRQAHTLHDVRNDEFDEKN